MTSSIIRIAARMGTAVACLAAGVVAATAQTAPVMKFGHAGPPVGAHEAPAGSIASMATPSGVTPMTHTTKQGNTIHAHPTVAVAAANKAAMGNTTPKATSGALVYHSGGSVMNPYVAVYPIFWAPTQLQSGASTGFSSLYGTIQILLGAWWQGHGLMNIATQYYQTINGTTTYVGNNGGLGGYYIDTAAYPASGCTDTVTPGNCITDAQVQAEITKVMNSQGWTGGLNKIYVLYTSSGEGSCFDSTSTSCAYTAYCAYHSYFSLNGANVIYANMPYGDPTHCWTGSVTQPIPNDTYGDLAANVASHEMMEAATDPYLNAWFDASGNEIGDLCAWQFGTPSWTGGVNTATVNQMWNGWYFELQLEYSNHTASCVSVGP